MPQMGWLARQDGYDLDAFDVPLEQSTGVGWANRMGEILHARRPDDPTVVATTASPLVTITEGDIGRATDAAMGVSGGGLSTKGIKAYHSSPHDFDKFDLAKIGSGEGAQAYGHGLYFAESPAVSGQGGQYWQQFARRFEGPEALAAEHLKAAAFDRAKAIAKLQESGPKIGKETDDLYRQLFDANPPVPGGGVGDYTKAVRLLESGKPVGPRTYEVNIKADPAHMLDWDKPLREQSANVAAAFKHEAPTQSGAEAYHRLADEAIAGRILPNAPGDANVKALQSQYLREAGIPGIKYLDQGSRGNVDINNIRGSLSMWEKALTKAPTDEYAQAQVAAYRQQLADAEKAVTSNYVIFDPNLIRIDKKYALPLAAAPAGMGALAAQDRYE